MQSIRWGQKSTVIANLETILEQTVICADDELAALDEKKRCSLNLWTERLHQRDTMIW